MCLYVVISEVMLIPKLYVYILQLYVLKVYILEIKSKRFEKYLVTSLILTMYLEELRKAIHIDNIWKKLSFLPSFSVV